MLKSILRVHRVVSERSRSPKLLRPASPRIRSRGTLAEVKPDIPTLPPELIDVIIDHLHGDLISLRACSLTCRAWLESARHHLFYTVSLVKTTDTASLNALTYLYPHLLRHLRHIVLDNQPIFQQDHFNSFDHPPLDVLIKGALAASPNLRSLTILGRGLTTWSALLASGVLSCFHAVTRLRLVVDIPTDPHELVRLLEPFLGLQNLELEASGVFARRDPVHVTQRLCNSLSHLSLRGEGAPFIMRWLAGSLLLRNLVALKIKFSRGTMESALMPLKTLLNAVGPTLTDLRLVATSSDAWVVQRLAEADPIDCSALTALRTLHLQVDVIQSLSWLSTLLLHIPSPDLQRITVDCRLLTLQPVATSLEDIQWPALDRAFADTARRPALRSVRLRVQHDLDHTPGMLEVALRIRLPRAAARGVLCVCDSRV